MTLQKLAQMAQIIGQMKTVLNTSSLSRYSKEDVNALKKKLVLMEDAFLADVLSLSLTQEVISVPSCRTVGEVQIKGGTITVSAPSDTVLIAGSTDALSVTQVINDAPKTVEPAPTKEDPELKKRLLEEKKKLAAKKKKTV